MRRSFLMTSLIMSSFALSSCGVHKVVTVPVKGVYETTKFVGKTAVGGTKLVGKTAVGGTKLVGKTVVGGTKMVGEGLWATGKGIYYIGSVPVKVTNAALDTSAKVLTITTQAVDLTGKVVTVSRDIQAARLDAELAGLKTAKNVLSVLVDVAR